MRSLKRETLVALVTAVVISGIWLATTGPIQKPGSVVLAQNSSSAIPRRSDRKPDFSGIWQADLASIEVLRLLVDWEEEALLRELSQFASYI